MSWKPKKKKGYIGLNTGFVPSNEQLKWFDYCNKKGIIISPIPASKEQFPESWHVGVSFSKDFKKVYKTPHVYEKEDIWEETYKTMKFYYDKK